MPSNNLKTVIFFAMGQILLYLPVYLVGVDVIGGGKVIEAELTGV